MKRVFRLILFAVSLLCCEIGHSQNDFMTLTSSDFIKGLDNKDFLRKKLTENGFTVVAKNGKDSIQNDVSEYWQFKSLLYVDIIYTPGKENFIKVAVNESFTGFPDRLIQSFPRKKMEGREEHVSAVKVTPTNKKISYSLVFARDSNNVRVAIWFDQPYYFFQYKVENNTE